MTVLMISVPITLFNYSFIFYSLHFVVELFTSFFLSILLNTIFDGVILISKNIKIARKKRGWNEA